MFNDLMRVGNYGANVFSSGFGIATDPAQVQGMNETQMAEYIRRQGDPTNRPWPSLLEARAMQNAAHGRPHRKSTMTLAEYDARRAAFRHAP